MIGHRRVKVLLAEDTLNALFKMPPGTRVVSCEARSDPPQVSVILEGPALPIQAFATEAPIAPIWKPDSNLEPQFDVVQPGFLEPAGEKGVEEVAFMLFQLETQREDDWEGPVTMEHWQMLTVESEREEFRQLARAVMAVVR